MLRRSLVTLAPLAALLCASASSRAADARTIVVGGKNFTEQQIIAQLTAVLLKTHGFDVDKRSGLGTAVLRQAQEGGQIDVYWEYTGTSLITFNKITDKLDADATYTKVKALDAAKGLVWLNPSRANTSYAFAMRRKAAQAAGIASLSDLAARIKAGQKLKFGCNAEFYARPDGLAPLQALYGFEFGRPNIVRMDGGLIAQALRDEQLDVGLLLATDGRVAAFDFVILRDDKGHFPAYALTPVIRRETLDRHPQLAAILNGLSARIDDAVMTRLNASVDVDNKSIEEVAALFLATHAVQK